MESLSHVFERIRQIQVLLGESPASNQERGEDPTRAEAAEPSQGSRPNPHPRPPQGDAFRTELSRASARNVPADFRPLIEEAAASSGLSQALITAVIDAESGFRPDAVSRSGARGLMQLMPGTARGLGVDDPFDPRQNVLGGAEYLRQQLQRFGSVEKALAAYNAGPGAVERHGGIPPYPETQSYVRRVLGTLRRWIDRRE